MENKFELDAIIELFGHQKMAGKVSEQTIAGASFIRIDVPEIETQPAFTRYLNPSSVYAINPVKEEVMLQMVSMLKKKPIDAWDIREMQKKLLLLDPKKTEDENEDLPI